MRHLLQNGLPSKNFDTASTAVIVPISLRQCYNRIAVLMAHVPLNAQSTWRAPAQRDAKALAETLTEPIPM
jgi:hypothetical protein